MCIFVCVLQGLGREVVLVCHPDRNDRSIQVQHLALGFERRGSLVVLEHGHYVTFVLVGGNGLLLDPQQVSSWG